MKLIITDSGDLSVGIQPQYFEIDVPVVVGKVLDSTDMEELEYFREKMYEIYKEWCEGRIFAEYDFELKRESQEEKEIDNSE